MIIYRHANDIPGTVKGGVAALGNFDGFHRGHHVVLGEAGRVARQAEIPFGVITTEPHPRSFFQPDQVPFRLTPFQAKIQLLERFGLDFALVLPFNAELAQTKPADFVHDVIVDGLGLSHVVVGYDYRFGHGRKGDAALLAELGNELSFKATVIDPVTFGVEGSAGEVYSSTHIRDALRNGEVRRAAAMLGHWWSVRGHVLAGAGRGHKLGFPTANLEFQDSLVPRHGVYAVRILRGADMAEEIVEGVANVGTRPTFDDGQVLLEAHIFDFDRNINGEHLTVEFVGFIRPELRFGGADELVSQIQKDCQAAHSLLSDPENSRDRLPPVTLENYLARFPEPPARRL